MDASEIDPALEPDPLDWWPHRVKASRARFTRWADRVRMELSFRLGNASYRVAPPYRQPADVDVRACIRCGCTDDRACPGGCSWACVVPAICSRCIDPADDFALSP